MTWCVDNPKHFQGYGEDNWGLTASYSVVGYAAHAPDDEERPWRHLPDGGNLLHSPIHPGNRWPRSDIGMMRLRGKALG